MTAFTAWPLTRTRRLSLDRAVLATVWVLSVVYLIPFVDRGWIPHDEGCLAQSAERVLGGEIPHRDFDEIYTGGLSYLHALSFRIIGVKLISLRYVLFGFVLIWIPTVYGIARRFTSPIAAAAIALLALAWSVPNYFAGVPSWYNLFFATFGTFFLLRHVETGRGNWVFLAGLCGGLSFLIKVVGLYYVAAALLFLLYRERLLSPPLLRRKWSLSPLLLPKAIISLVFVGALTILLRTRPRPMEIVNLAVPGLVVAVILVWSEATEPGGSFGTRFPMLAKSLFLFLSGTILPVVAFLALYLPNGASGDFLRGVFVLPQRRLVNASTQFPPFGVLTSALPYALLLVYPFRQIRRGGERWLVLGAAILLGVLLASSIDSVVYSCVWNSARFLAPLVVLSAALTLLCPGSTSRLSPEGRQRLYLLACITALVCLVQFPFAAPIYYCFVAPFVILTALATIQAQPRAPKLLHSCVLAFYLLFAVLWTNRSYVWDLGLRYRPYEVSGRLARDRGGLRIPLTDSLVYGHLLGLIREHAAGGRLYAAPDSPEVYFLSGLKNPTRAILDFNSVFPTDGLPIPEFLQQAGVRTVVINRRPEFSGPMAPDVVGALRAAYPFSKEEGRFLVLWRD